MKLEELLAKLQEVNAKLKSEGIDDLTALDLDILADRLKKKIITGAFDPLLEISDIDVPDISQLDSLIGQVEQEIQNEEKRVQLVKGVISITKKGLAFLGLPIP